MIRRWGGEGEGARKTEDREGEGEGAKMAEHGEGEEVRMTEVGEGGRGIWGEEGAVSANS